MRNYITTVHNIFNTHKYIFYYFIIFIWNINALISASNVPTPPTINTPFTVFRACREALDFVSKFNCYLLGFGSGLRSPHSDMMINITKGLTKKQNKLVENIERKYFWYFLVWRSHFVKKFKKHTHTFLDFLLFFISVSTRLEKLLRI